MNFRNILIIVATIFLLSYPAAATDDLFVTEYTLPVSPLNLLVDSNGDVWFSSFQDNAIGKLEVETSKIYLYTRQNSGNVWDIKRDHQGNLWFTTANGRSIGKFEPATGTFLEWEISWKPFGLEIDPVTGDVWFSGQGVDAAGIYRITPSTNQTTFWSVSPYTNATDVDISASGDIWFTVQPGYYQGVGRLDLLVEQMVIWTMPIPDSEPFRVIAETDSSIWLTERGPDANAIAQFLPYTSTLKMFHIPTPESAPWDLLITGSKIWFTEREANGIGRLEPGLAYPTTANLVSIPIPYEPVESIINPTSYSVSPQVTTASIFTNTVTPLETNGFLELQLPSADSQPSGIAVDIARSTLWFAETAVKRIGKLETGETTSDNISLPLVMRGE